MSSYSRYFPPALKSTVDLQLQSAFGEGNWAAAARLAGKRAKSLQDPYYEAIRLCAESQLDGLGEKCAVLVKVADLVRQGTVVKDLDVLDLYEWACRDFLDDLDYSATLGLLRLRWAKQNPRSPGVMPCLQACLQHWDLVNAQQIAVLLDKSAPPTSTDRRFMYWSIVLTYLLSISPQCPDGKKDLYGLLALKQLERAADLTEASDKDDRTDRGLRTEEEIYLFYRVLARLGTRSDFVKRLRSPRIGPLAQFEKGRKHLLWMALDALDAGREWDDVYDLCLAALGRKEDGNDEAPSFLAADWRVWKSFITAASRRSDPQAAFAEVQKLLDAFIATKAPVAQMYKKNIALAVLEATFRLPESLLPDTFLSASPMPRVAQIGLFLDQNFDRPSAFDDVKGYVSSLSVEEVQYFLGEMLPKLSEGQWTVKSSLIAVLDLKFRYFLTTCPQTLSPAPAPAVPPPDGADRRSSFLCLVNARWTPEPYSACLLGLVQSAAAATRKLSADAELMKSLPALDKDPRIDLSLVWGLSLLKLAGLTGRHASSSSPSGSPLENVDPSLFLQAVLLLDTQLKKTPGDTSLRLLLVRLYLLLGCASYAYRLWVPMDVKRTIQDALSPLFFDRLSSLAPGLFQGGRPPTEPLRAYYQTTLQDRAPVRIWDAFAAGSYTSILDMADYDDRLRRSCTLVMSVVEERRAARAFGGRLDGNMEDLPLMADIHDETELVSVTDYGSFPNLESPHSPPVQALVRLGPDLSNERAHLSILAEKFLDIVDWTPPKDYKPLKPGEVAAKDRTYLAESFERLHNSLTGFLHLPSTPEKLTPPEETYFTVVALLAGILHAAVSCEPSGAVPSTLSVLASSLKLALSSLRTAAVLSRPPSRLDADSAGVVAGLTGMHGLSTLRDAALAVRRSASFVSALHEREAARDKSGRFALHRDVLAEVRAADAAAAKVLDDVRARVQTLQARLGEGGLLDRVLDWTLGPEGSEDELARAVADVVGGRPGAEDWAGQVIESWRDGIKGWANVRLE